MKDSRGRKRRRWGLGVALMASLLAAYWLKCRLDIDLSARWSLSSVFPFSSLQAKSEIIDPDIGFVVEDSFDERRRLDAWRSPWMGDPGQVTRDYEHDRNRDSRCLVIRSESEGSWACPHRFLVAVQVGDVFRLAGRIHVERTNSSGFVAVVALDEKEDVIEWHYASEGITSPGPWVDVKREFKITPGTSFIRLRLVGKGVGEVRFDDVSLEQLSVASQM